MQTPDRCKHGCKRENPNSYDGFGDGNVVWGCNMLGINGFVPPSYVLDAAAKAVNENRLDVALSMLTLLKETL